MTSINGVLEVATRNANSCNDLAIAAGQVFAKRIALGVAAVFDPLRADHVEFGRMVPEKMQAFSASGMIMLQKAGQAGEQIAQFASDAAGTAARATFAVAGTTNPIEMALTQGRFALAWFEQAACNMIEMGMFALGAQAAAMAPIKETIAANSARLEA